MNAEQNERAAPQDEKAGKPSTQRGVMPEPKEEPLLAAQLIAKRTGER